MLSLDQAGTISGVVFDDDTVLIHDGSTWAVAVDASDQDPRFGTADLVAMPEPGVGTGLVLGIAALVSGVRPDRERAVRR